MTGVLLDGDTADFGEAPVLVGVFNGLDGVGGTVEDPPLLRLLPESYVSIICTTMFSIKH